MLLCHPNLCFCAEKHTHSVGLTYHIEITCILISLIYNTSLARQLYTSIGVCISISDCSPLNIVRYHYSYYDILWVKLGSAISSFEKWHFNLLASMQLAIANATAELFLILILEPQEEMQA